MFGLYRIAAISPKLSLANPKANAKEIIVCMQEAQKEKAAIALFSELTLTGYSVGDLFFQSRLYNAQLEALEEIVEASKELDVVAILGLALRFSNRLYNCALILQKGEILGVVPKTFLPNKQEFYEQRHFVSGADIKEQYITLCEQDVPFGVDLLFSNDKDLCFGVEICEDLWATTPPSNALAEAGANVICNLSASNAIIAKAEYRENLVSSQSSRLICAYAYASSGIGESGSDTIFSGDLIIAEYGRILNRDKRFSFESKIIYADIDVERVSNIRYLDSSFAQSDLALDKFRRYYLKDLNEIKQTTRSFNPHPFIPKAKEEQEKRSEEITDIQAYALIRRMQAAHAKRAILGISGGLDSTLALLAVHKAFKIASWDSKDIICYTMPGFGTTSRTLQNAIKLCTILGVTLKEVDIKDISRAEFKAIEHDERDLSVTYENVQARARTAILMNSANKLNGIVVGTGDLSEIALGWSTYNGDHMSMYGLNSGIPKTLIRYLIEYFAKDELKEVLEDILDTPVSPELLPNESDKIAQVTEDIVGPYELHDFFLYHFIREAFSPKKILFIAKLAFQEKYDEATIKKWLKLFIKRFFTQQFKRNAMPDGIMVGTISLSPRANWRMPSDATFAGFLEELEE
jgi:NAD+ synthase (glutamine-hydrolysing)